MDSEKMIVILREMLPNFPDDSVLDYMSTMFEEDSTELMDDLVGFLTEYAGGEAQAKKLALNLRSRAFAHLKGAAAVEHHNDGVTLLQAPVIIAKAVKENEKLENTSTLLFGNTEVNVNTSIKTFVGDTIDADEEAMAMRMKREKKDAKREKRSINRERTAAPLRNAIIEKLTQQPVVIHGLLGEDGSYGGNPCVDIQLKDVTIDLGGLPILENANLTLAYGRHYGLVGRNGVGKTTFLKYFSSKTIPGIPWYLQVLHIEQEIEGNELTALETVLATDVERCRLMQEKAKLEVEEGQTLDKLPFHALSLEDVNMVGVTSTDPGERLAQVYDRLDEIDADGAEPRAAEILSGLQFTPEMMKMPTNSLSGGWRMRVSLARALFIHPDILLLDEPTNHLDLHAVLWLEEYLKTFENTLIVVSHAREFLNEVCTDILLMKDLTLTRYKGNFNSYEQQRSDEIARHEKAKETSDKAREKIQAFIDKNIGGGAKGASMAKSRQKMLAKMDVFEGIVNDPTVQFKIPQPGPVSGGWGIRLVDVGFGYPGHDLLFKGVEFSINQNSRICLVGPNGIGKSTLLKVIYQELEPTIGMVTRNQRLRVGRFAQHHVDGLNMKKSALEQFIEDYPTDPPQKIRQHLGSMGVIGELQIKPIYTLSGGQKSRVALAMITYSAPHLLLLDEPTNHLDFDTVQALIRALATFEGGVLVVSHDEHLITATCDELWIIRDKQVIQSKGDFQDYKMSIVKNIHKRK
eukprot:m.119637 g.119637  ORF g.119637 m.119637 type:complete len:746 (+) comp16157_c1_seq1:131-2368(+)